MLISAIVAMSENHVIGNNNKLPWHLPEDLKHFKETTMGRPILMGRLTFESIGKPLPGRRNIIVSRNTNYAVTGCEVFQSLQEAFDGLKNEKEIFIIGGAQIYQQALPFVDKLYLTIIHKKIEGDAIFPPLIESEWQVSEESERHYSEKQGLNFSYLTLIRNTQ